MSKTVTITTMRIGDTWRAVCEIDGTEYIHDYYRFEDDAYRMSRMNVVNKLGRDVIIEHVRR